MLGSCQPYSHVNSTAWRKTVSAVTADAEVKLDPQLPNRPFAAQIPQGFALAGGVADDPVLGAVVGVALAAAEVAVVV